MWKPAKKRRIDRFGCGAVCSIDGASVDLWAKVLQARCAEHGTIEFVCFVVIVRSDDHVCKGRHDFLVFGADCDQCRPVFATRWHSHVRVKNDLKKPKWRLSLASRTSM